MHESTSLLGLKAVRQEEKTIVEAQSFFGVVFWITRHCLGQAMGHNKTPAQKVPYSLGDHPYKSLLSAQTISVCH